MNRFNFSRRTLYIVLSIVLISVFTLTIAYAALSVTLNISGSAEVAASNWDVHLDNVKVTNGSVSGNAPTITSAISASFSTALTTPGDFYEFTIDVVNDGTIDAMINSINKSPTLSAEQAKYLKYEITYQNGETVNTKQLVKSGSFVRLMVRVEFRNDITAADLPSTAQTLNLSFSVNYVQSDGSGSDISNNGALMNNPKFAVGEEFCFGDECFHVLEDDGTTVTAITKYCLETNYYVTGPYMYDFVENPSGLQMKSSSNGSITMFGGYPTCFYSQSNLPNFESYPVDYYSHDLSIGFYITGYVDYLTTEYDVNVLDARVISLRELIDFGCTESSCANAPDFLQGEVYWTSTFASEYENYYVSDTLVSTGCGSDEYNAGVRPVLEFATSDF